MDLDKQEESMEMLSMDSESGQRQRKAPNRFAQLSRHFQVSCRSALLLSRRCTHRCGWTLFLVSCLVMVVYVLWLGDTPLPPHLQKKPYAPVGSQRAASVKHAFLHAYGGYEMYTTFPDDELKPISNSGERK